MIISKLYKIGDTSVFYSPNLGAVRQEYFEGLMSGELKGYSTNGEEMGAVEAAESFILMCDYPVGSSLLDQIYRNILVASIIISIVKEELIYEDDEDGKICMFTLADVIATLQTGSFGTAAALCRAIEPTDILTSERLETWANMCDTADAIELVE